MSPVFLFGVLVWAAIISAILGQFQAAAAWLVACVFAVLWVAERDGEA
jgi:hypothetical protein